MQIGHYQILGELGEGGMASVLRARDPYLGREVAIKLLRGSAADSPVAPERFLREARAVAKLNHPNVVPVLAAGEERGALFMVMDLVAGENLDFSRRLELEDSADVRNNRGVAYFDQDDFETAFADFRVAAAEKPTAMHLSNAGEALTRLGRYDEALPYLDRAVTEFPEQALGWYRRGKLRLARGEAKLALDDLMLGAAIGPKVGLPIAEARLALGDTEGAIHELERAHRALEELLQRPAESEAAQFDREQREETLEKILSKLTELRGD